MRLTRFEPFRLADLERVQRREQAWRPAADIVEYDDAFLVRLDVPGVRGEDIDIQSDKGVLTISGERKPFDAGEDGRMSRSERLSGRFERRFSLPETTDVDQIRAQARDGILEVRLPKRPEVQPRKITVEAA